MGNTSIILILRDHNIPYRVIDGVVRVPISEYVLADAEAKAKSKDWVKVPDIVSALWVVGKL